MIHLDDVIAESSYNQRPQRRPDWITVSLRSGENYDFLKKLMRSKQLHTVCEEARCPNIGDCWPVANRLDRTRKSSPGCEGDELKACGHYLG